MRYQWNRDDRRQVPPWLGIVVSLFMLVIGVTMLFTEFAQTREALPMVFMVCWCGIVIANLIRNIIRLMKQRKKKSGDETYYNPRTGHFDSSASSLYRPYCGTPVDGDYEYCNRCGRRLP